MNIDTDRPSLTEREAIAHSMRGSGFSFVEIASKMGVSPSRARALWLNAKNKHEEWDKRKSHPLFGLSVRTMNSLIFSGIDTREKVIEALATGCSPRGPKIYGFGPKQYAEACKWAGVENRKQERRRWRFDPYTGKPLA